ncbi:MAG: hypothetical protein IT429_22575 [Gemmataceae bacterium]|nr:hypothetical protein [Gemmataceae bacterium]
MKRALRTLLNTLLCCVALPLLLLILLILAIPLGFFFGAIFLALFYGLGKEGLDRKLWGPQPVNADRGGWKGAVSTGLWVLLVWGLPLGLLAWIV